MSNPPDQAMGGEVSRELDRDAVGKELAQIVQRTRVIPMLPFECQEEVVRHLRSSLRWVPDGTNLLTPSTASTSLLVIVRGRAEWLSSAEPRIALDWTLVSCVPTLPEGSFIGEAGLFLGNRQPAKGRGYTAPRMRPWRIPYPPPPPPRCADEARALLLEEQPEQLATRRTPPAVWGRRAAVREELTALWMVRGWSRLPPDVLQLVEDFMVLPSAPRFPQASRAVAHGPVLVATLTRNQLLAILERAVDPAAVRRLEEFEVRRNCFNNVATEGRHEKDKEPRNREEAALVQADCIEVMCDDSAPLPCCRMGPSWLGC